MKALSVGAMALIAALVGVGITVSLGAAQEPKPDSSKAAVSAPLLYKPPLRGAPAGRVGGGTRGVGSRDMFVLSALVPDDSALTASEQPSLYWFISNVTTLPVEVTISDPRATEPLLETRLPGPIQPGVHRIRLADHGIRLAPGVAYRWSITVIPDLNRRSRDILAGGTIERIEPPFEFREQLKQSRQEDRPALFAGAGLWYDALASISELIEKTPNDEQLRKQRSALLTQVGLPELADSGR
jgi:hypothetical protein